VARLARSAAEENDEEGSDRETANDDVCPAAPDERTLMNSGVQQRQASD
jgi:hypothetical protein